MAEAKNNPKIILIFFILSNAINGWKNQYILGHSLLVIEILTSFFVGEHRRDE